MADKKVTRPEFLTNTSDPLVQLWHDNGDGTWSQVVYTGGGSGSSSSSASGSGGESYSNTRLSFVATPNTGAKTITLTSQVAALQGMTLTAANFISGSAKKIDSSGVVTTLPLTNVAYNSGTGVLTLSDMTSNFASGDIVELVITGVHRAYDRTNDASYVRLKDRLDIVNDAVVSPTYGHNDTPISTATTTTVKSGAGTLASIRVLGGTMGNVTVYDNTAASGTILVPAVTPAAGQILLSDVGFVTGLTIVTAAATILVVTWR